MNKMTYAKGKSAEPKKSVQHGNVGSKGKPGVSNATQKKGGKRY